jgi:hypothetical protein
MQDENTVWILNEGTLAMFIFQTTRWGSGLFPIILHADSPCNDNAFRGNHFSTNRQEWLH